VLVQYSVHQLLQRRGVAALVLGAIVVVGYIAYTAYPDPLFVIVAMAILIFSVSAFLFPIRYRLTNRGVYFRNFTSNEFRAWDRFYDYFIYKDAVLLSFDYRTLRGRIQKGFLVYFDAKQEHKQKLLEVIGSRINRPPRQPGAAKPQRRGLFPLFRRGAELPPPGSGTTPAVPAPESPQAGAAGRSDPEAGGQSAAGGQSEGAVGSPAVPSRPGDEPGGPAEAPRRP
jgi:hypothetical protein